MWICFNNGFVSAVQDKRRPARLIVRARKRSHLERLFPGKRISVSPEADYGFRISVSKKAFAKMVVRRIGAISYSNFKDSVQDDDLHALYLDFWQQHFRFQQGAYDDDGWRRLKPETEWPPLPSHQEYMKNHVPTSPSLRLDTNAYGEDEWTKD